MKKLLKYSVLALTLLGLCSCSGDKTENKEPETNQKEENNNNDDNGNNGEQRNDDKNKENPDEKENEGDFNITFNLNYDGSEPVTKGQTTGSILVSPVVTRTGYLFSYWAKDSEGKTAFDLTEKVSSETTLYAIWIEDNDSAVTVTFHDDKSEDGIYLKMSVASGSRLKAFPGASYLKTGYYFKNWYTTSTYETVASNMLKYTADSDIYARWYNADVFEAEYTQLDGLTKDQDKNINNFGEKIGHGYSSDVSGTGLIFSDKEIGSECSNHYFICDLYYKDAFIEFDIASDRDTSEAILIATLSAEYFDMTFTSANWIVEVNGVSIDYPTIVLDNVPTGRDVKTKRAFSDHTLSTSVSLKKGDNVIKLITNNSTRHDSTGTMAAEAPMIDCLTCYSECELVFDEYTENIESNS